MVSLREVESRLKLRGDSAVVDRRGVFSINSGRLVHVALRQALALNQ